MVKMNLERLERILTHLGSAEKKIITQQVCFLMGYIKMKQVNYVSIKRKGRLWKKYLSWQKQWGVEELLENS